MMQTLGYEQYLEAWSTPGVRLFVVLLDQELPFLTEQDSNWIHHLRIPTHFVRLTEEEFKLLDYGTHPKAVLMDGSKELHSFRGVPSMSDLQRTLRKLKI
jgi:hypothetical protein